jgi:glycosyltransferase involved in cell wall biosynthesis
VLSTVHNVYEGGWPRMLAYALTDRLSARTTAVSHAAARRFVKLRAIPGHKCIVLSNAIDTVEFAPNPERRTQMRAEMGVDAEFIWLTAGRIVQAKDIPNLLRSFARVRASLPDAQLWIAGEAIGAEKYRMRGLSAVLGVADAVQWLGLRRDLPSLLDAADGFVLASAWEGMPLAVGEAMAMEKPVVATDVGGVRELVGSAGLIVPRKDPTALGDGMIEIMRKPSEERQALGQAARSRIRSNFDMDIRVEDWEALYNAVLESR